MADLTKINFVLSKKQGPKFPININTRQFATNNYNNYKTNWVTLYNY